VTHLSDEIHDPHPRRQIFSIGLAVAATVPGIYVRLAEPHLAHPLEALLFGLAIVGAAFMLSWAAEVAQLDISAGLAIAVLAFIAVLPEYAVDMVLAWQGGNDFEQFGRACIAPDAVGRESNCSLALANMTGANRLLIGIGWSLVVFIAFYRSRKASGPVLREIALERPHAVEVSFLAIATLYSLTLPLKGSITLVDAAILVSIFVAYTIRISRAPAEEPHLVGPARWVGGFSVRGRRITTIGMFVFSATVILLCAELFAEALKETGAEVGISEFLLIQWLAPLASEAPELLIAGLYAWRLNTNAGLGTLVSSKVNQWTLLVGTLPIVFALASSSAHGLPIDAHQREELLLTAAQSFFALAVLVTLSISLREALLLFTLFWAQFIIGGLVPEQWQAAERVGVSVVYILLGLAIFARERRLIGPLLRDGFRTPYRELGKPRPGVEGVDGVDG
jgi:cation:H+ antiporter